MYTEGNPVNYTDPSGFNPNCQNDPETCAIERAVKEILGNEHGLKGLLELFNDQELYNTWGNVAGRTVGERLDWVLRISQSVMTVPLVSLRPFRIDDCQIADPRQWRRLSRYEADSYFGQGYGFGTAEGYAREFVETDNSDQSSHFLTAVGLTKHYGVVGLIGIIGHEKYASPPNNNGNFDTIIQVSRIRWTDVYHFLKAVKYDEAGFKKDRDSELWPILGFGQEIEYDPSNPYEDTERPGNTLQDLRLSVKGYRFANWATQNSGLPPWFASGWLYNHLAEPGLERPTAWWANTTRQR